MINHQKSKFFFPVESDGLGGIKTFFRRKSFGLIGKNASI
jgi:hypothetical protein